MSTLKYIIDKYNLSEKIEKKEWPVRIIGACRIDLAQIMIELGFKGIGVEVGVAQGEFLCHFLKHVPMEKWYGIDPFVPYKGYTDYTLRKTFETLENKTKENIGGFKNCEIIKEFSMDAVKRFEDNSLDFVYIDANHRNPWVSEDIVEWAKKVRPGGIVAGHDYVSPKQEGVDCQYAVKEAIQKYIKDNDIYPWFVLGSDDKRDGTRRDSARSWMFIKPESEI